jgi:nitrogen fixation protein FixH
MTDRRGAYWPWLLAAALLFTVGANVVMLFAANSDRNGSVVEPDYYAKAVAWDQTMAERRASDLLGWTATAIVERSRSGADSAAVTGGVVVHLRDRAGAPVSGARVTAVAIHNVDAGHPIELALHERAPGVYGAGARIAHPGRWEVRVQALRDAARFGATLIVEAEAPGARSGAAGTQP